MAAWARDSDLVPVRIESADGRWQEAFALPDIETRLAAVPPLTSQVRIINPFDPAVRDRARLKRIFGFDYTNEMFVPAAKRRWGYYVYPLLEGDSFVGRIEAKGYTLVRLELRNATRELLAEHYAEHEGKPFYEPLVEFMLSGPVAAIVIEGERCIEGFRSLAGATDPTVAAPGTIRGDLGRDWGLAVQQNLVHGSDSPESAAREIGIWFPEGS